MYIVADFTKMLTLDDYRNTIESKLRNLDVSMLIINAGMGGPGPFNKNDEDLVSNILTCNMMQCTYLPKLMVNQLNSRFEKTCQKAAMIFVSSISAIRPMPGVALYSSSKIYTSYLAEALAYELKDTVDVISYRPGEVDTNMNPNNSGRQGFISAERAVTVCFRDLGVDHMTYGDESHEIKMLSMTKDP